MHELIHFGERHKKTLINLLELALIATFAVWVGRVYLDFNEYHLPTRGNDDFIISIFPFFPITNLFKCGTCILWNGLLNGGSPTFGDSIAGIAHPLFSSVVLFFGVLNGVKVLLIVSLILGGWGQWWIAKVLDIGTVARFWMSFLGVVAGNLAGPLYSGDVTIVFSIASCSLAIAPALKLAISGNRRDAIILGLFIGQALLSGAGYLQLAIVFCFIPALAIFLFDHELRLKIIWKEFALAVIIAGMISVVHFLPIFSLSNSIIKPTDPISDQPIEYIPINLIARDLKYFLNDSMGKIVSPNLYSNYIGWLPLIFSVIGFKLLPRGKNRIFIFFILLILLLFFLGSGLPIRFLSNWFTGIFVGIRNPGFVIGLSVTVIIATGGWGLDMLLKLKWPALILENNTRSFSLSTRYILLPFLVFSIYSNYEFNDQFRYLTEWPNDLVQTADALKSGQARWIRGLYGNWPFTAILVDKNLKVTDAYRIWDLKDRPNPTFQIDINNDPASKLDTNFLNSIGEINVLVNPDNYYSYVETTGGRIPCKATSVGGLIDVNCETDKPGQLFLQEHNWQGWSVSRDSKSVSLSTGSWLNLPAPAGKHSYRFRFVSAEFLAGLLITICGLVLGLKLWFQAQEPTSTQPE